MEKKQVNKKLVVKKKEWKDMTERERMFMTDKHGLPLNPALGAKKTQKYGALQQY